VRTNLPYQPALGATLWNRSSFWYVIFVMLGLMSVEYLRALDIRSQPFLELRNEITLSILDRGNQSIMVGLLSALHVALYCAKLRNQPAALPRKESRFAWLEMTDVAKSGLVLLSLIAYIWNTPQGSSQPIIARLLLGSDQSTNIMVLLTGIVLNQVLSLSLRGGLSKDVPRALTALLGFLCLSFILQAEGPHVYRYGDIIRKCGLWVNPNTHGLLMALGLVISLGLIFARFENADSGKARTNGPASTVMLAVIMLLLGWQLLHSFSRGAWLAAASGATALLWRYCSPDQPGNRTRLLQLRRTMLPIAVLGASLLVIGFWFLRDAPHGVVRRLYSINNPNDFSIRNRITAWSGALEMIKDRPVTGYGWGSAETVYENYYMPLELDDGKAIGLNDYSTLGLTLGLTGLGMFSMLFLAHWKRVAGTFSRPGSIPWICNAGLLTLLVGFAFEGGLFKLATAAPFWILLELGTLHAPPKE